MNSRSRSDSSPNEDDTPIRTGGKFQINKKVARKRALEEKEKTEAKAKGQTTQGSSAKKENGKVKVVSFDLKGKAKRLFKKRYVCVTFYSVCTLYDFKSAVIMIVEFRI